MRNYRLIEIVRDNSGRQIATLSDGSKWRLRPEEDLVGAGWSGTQRIAVKSNGDGDWPNRLHNIDLREIVDAKCQASEWISVEEFMPEEDIPVLVFFNGACMTIGCLQEDVWIICPNLSWLTNYDERKREDIYVTHWMRLPNIPNVDSVEIVQSLDLQSVN